MRHPFTFLLAVLTISAVVPSGHTQSVSPLASQTMRGTVSDAVAKAPVIGTTAGLDLLDLFEYLLDLESCFHIPIPDEVPLFTIGDLLNYLATSLRLRLPF